LTNAHRPKTLPTPEQVRAGWDRIAAGFDEHLTPLNISDSEEVLRRVGLTDGMRCLDVICGSGALAIQAARAGAHVVATDISPATIERLTARARREGMGDLHARVMDGHALDLDDDTFDLALSQHGVSLFPDIDRGLREIARVTRGRVVIVAFGPPPEGRVPDVPPRRAAGRDPGSSGPPMDPPPLPFQVADPHVLTGKLTEAGLRRWWSRPRPRTCRSGRRPCGRWSPAATPSVPSSSPGSPRHRRPRPGRCSTACCDERSGGSPEAVLHTTINIGTGTV
jgi:SAM-dependent methyltransferase